MFIGKMYAADREIVLTAPYAAVVAPNYLRDWSFDPGTDAYCDFGHVAHRMVEVLQYGGIATTMRFYDDPEPLGSGPAVVVCYAHILYRFVTTGRYLRGQATGGTSVMVRAWEL